MRSRELFDVAVIGGGSAGVAAALAAARLGARSLLVERCDALGGNVSQAFVHTICGLYHAAREDGDAMPANEGLCRDLPEELLRCGAARPPERAGKVWVLPITPRAYAGYLGERAIGAEGLSCRTRTRVVAAELSRGDSAESELDLAQGDSLQRVGASIVIDASGDGVSAELAGADSQRAAPSQLQRPSYIFRMQGVEAKALEGFGRLRLTASIAGAERAGTLPSGCESVLARPGAKDDEAYVTLNLPALEGEDFDPQCDAYRERMEDRGRSFAEAIAAFLRDQHEPFRHASIASHPRRLGVREGSRLLGRSVVEAADLLDGKRCDDEVAISSWPIELWQDHRRAQLRYPSGPASIPLAALVSRSHPRLGMAGRCMSASHEALGALRVIGTALATGDAVGRAAALAADTGRSLWQVEAEEVRESIRAS